MCSGWARESPATTHGHVDDLCRFIKPDTILLVEEKNPRDDNYRILEENKERLREFKLQDGSKPEVGFLPMPQPVILQRAAASRELMRTSISPMQPSLCRPLTTETTGSRWE